jgi:hypothetical protein
MTTGVTAIPQLSGPINATQLNVNVVLDVKNKS